MDYFYRLNWINYWEDCIKEGNYLINEILLDYLIENKYIYYKNNELTITNKCSHYNHLTIDLPNLKSFICIKKYVYSLDIKECINLEELICSNNELTELHIENLNNLKYLNCSYNNLTELHIENLTNLKHLDCQHNNIKNININTLINLEHLNISNTKIIELNINKLSKITHLDCYSDYLKNLFISINNYKYFNVNYNNTLIILNKDVNFYDYLPELTIKSYKTGWCVKPFPYKILTIDKYNNAKNLIISLLEN